MRRLRSSLSVQRVRPGEDDELPLIPTSENSGRVQSSVDTYVIPGRTRYPSSRVTDPDPVDLRVAQRLLSYTGDSNLDDNENKHTATVPARRVSYPVSKNSSLRSALQSGKVALINDESRDVVIFEQRYNRWAEKLDLQPLAIGDETYNQRPLDHQEQRSSAVRGFWHKLLRKQPSKDLRRAKSHSLLKKSSISSLLHSKSNVRQPFNSLAEVFKTCGASAVHLPPPHGSRSTPFLAPTCIAATANHLAQHGTYTPDIFRVPGNPGIVDSLYDHYMVELPRGHSHSEETQNIVGSSSLPPNIRYSMHDVASVFIEFIKVVPGGILGSSGLVDSLQDAIAWFAMSPVGGSERHKVLRRIIALALLSVKSVQRLSLIISVFGLLACVSQDSQREVAGSEHSLSTADAFGRHARSLVPSVVDQGTLAVEGTAIESIALTFAPLLIGPGSFSVEQKPATDASVGISQGSNRLKLMKSNGLNESSGRYFPGKITAKFIIQMLLVNWKDILHEMRLLETRYLGSRSVRVTSLRGRSSSTRVSDWAPYFQEPGIENRCHQWVDGTKAISSPRRSYLAASMGGNSDRRKSADFRMTKRKDKMMSIRQRNHSLRSVSTIECPGTTKDNSRYPCSTLEDGDDESLSAGDTILHSEKPMSTWGVIVEQANGGSESTQVTMKPATDLRDLSGATVVVHESRLSSTSSQAQSFVSNYADDNNDVIPETTLSGAKVDECHGRSWSGARITVPSFATSASDNKQVKASNLDSQIDRLTPELERQISGIRKGDKNEDMLTESIGDQSPVNRGHMNFREQSSSSVPNSAQRQQKSMLPRPVSDARFNVAGVRPDSNLVIEPLARLERDKTDSPKKQTPGVHKAGEMQNPQVSPTRANKSQSSLPTFIRKRDGGVSPVKLHLDDHEASVASPSLKRIDEMPALSKNPTSSSQVAVPTSPPPYVSDIRSESPSDAAASNHAEKPKLGTLFQEIRKVRQQLGSAKEKNGKLSQELEAIRKVKDSSLLSELLREKGKESRHWKHRAEWAENALSQGSRENSSGSGSSSQPCAEAKPTQEKKAQ